MRPQTKALRFGEDSTDPVEASEPVPVAQTDAPDLRAGAGSVGRAKPSCAICWTRFFSPVRGVDEVVPHLLSPSPPGQGPTELIGDDYNALRLDLALNSQAPDGTVDAKHPYPSRGIVRAP